MKGCSPKLEFERATARAHARPAASKLPEVA